MITARFLIWRGVFWRRRMNIVFNLSQAIDLQPLYELPIPPELFDGGEGAIFEKNYSFYRSAFPDSAVFVIDGCEKPVFHKMNSEIDVLNIPTQKLFTKYLLFSAFSIAFELDPITLFVPGNCLIQPFPAFAGLIRALGSNDLLSSSFTFFSSRKEGSYFSYIQPDASVAQVGAYKLYGIKNVVPAYEARRLKDEKQMLFGGTEVFCFSSMKAMEFFSETKGELRELFFLLIDAWRDEQSIDTAVKEVIRRLENYSLDEMIKKFDDAGVTGSEVKIETVSGLRDLLEYLT